MYIRTGGSVYSIIRCVEAVSTLNSQPGTYAIILRCSDEDSILIGQLGEFQLRKGHYIYIGSAFGAGGVRARVMRHHRDEKARHWHIDYLREHMPMVEAWYTHDAERREHRWVEVMTGMNLVPCLKGFGSSDCACYSHLFHVTARPKISLFRAAVTRQVAGHDRISVWTPTCASKSFRRPRR